MTNYIEFAQKIKEKYPEYKDIDDLTLAQKIIEKYPEYKERVTFNNVKEQKRAVDLTPSGMYKNVLVSAIGAPLRMAVKGEDYATARAKGLENLEKNKPAGGIADFLFDMSVYSKLPMLKGGGVAKFLGNAAIQGGVPGAVETMKRGGNVAGGAAMGTGIAGALPPAIKGAGAVVSKVANSNFVKNNVPKILQALTSVPAEYSERAIEKELAGNSILNGKFDAKTAYQPIERQIREAKNKLPSDVDFGNKYYNLGQKAIEGMKNIQNQAGEQIEKMLNELPQQKVDTNLVKNAVNSAIKNFAKGGEINPAEIRASKDIELVRNLLNKKGGVKPIDIHNIKELLYDIANYDTAGGIKNEAIKSAANQLKNYLRHIEPKYAKPNDTFANIKNVINGLESESTIGQKIKQIGTESNALSGMEKRLQEVDKILPKENKFYDEAIKLNQLNDEVSNIKNLVGKQYERNPRLLANRTDEAFENAIQDLQNRSNVDFMEELNNARAREALDKLFPGQGGGSGSEQGFGNLLRTAIIGGSPTAAVIGHNPAALMGLLAVSPKFTAKGTIKNIGKLSRFGNKAQSAAYDEAIRKLMPMSAKAGANMLYGGVEYNDYQ